MKNAHKNQEPVRGLTQFPTWGRGRPWKIPVIEQKHVITTDQIEAEAEWKRQQLNEKSEDFLGKLGVRGGPTNAWVWFDQNSEKYEIY